MVTIYLQSYITYSEFATDDLQVPGSDTGARGIARLTARSVWGILRGLETFGQLFYFSKNWKVSGEQSLYLPILLIEIVPYTPCI